MDLVQVKSNLQYFPSINFKDDEQYPSCPYLYAVHPIAFYTYKQQIVLLNFIQTF